jgi:hypothetical protein
MFYEERKFSINATSGIKFAKGGIRGTIATPQVPNLGREVAARIGKRR